MSPVGSENLRLLTLRDIQHITVKLGRSTALKLRLKWLQLMVDVACAARKLGSSFSRSIINLVGEGSTDYPSLVEKSVGASGFTFGLSAKDGLKTITTSIVLTVTALKDFLGIVPMNANGKIYPSHLQLADCKGDTQWPV
jgi:hypothetical protein